MPTYACYLLKLFKYMVVVKPQSCGSVGLFLGAGSWGFIFPAYFCFFVSRSGFPLAGVGLSLQMLLHSLRELVQRWIDTAFTQTIYMYQQIGQTEENDKDKLTAAMMTLQSKLKCNAIMTVILKTQTGKR